MNDPCFSPLIFDKENKLILSNDFSKMVINLITTVSYLVKFILRIIKESALLYLSSYLFI